MRKNQKYTLVVIFVLFWMAAIFAPLFAKEFKPPPEINAAIPAIIGTILALPDRGHGGNGTHDSATNRTLGPARSRDEEEE